MKKIFSVISEQLSVISKDKILSILLILFLFVGIAARVGVIESPIFGTSTTHNYATPSTVPYFDASKNLVSSAVTPTQLNRLTSAIGNVVGPASSTANSLAQFDGTTGKLLKDGPVIGTSANNIVQLDGSAKLPPVDGSQLTNLPNGGLGKLIAEGSGYGLDNGSINRVTLGVKAISLEYNGSSDPSGAGGDYSFTTGVKTLALGKASIAMGVDNKSNHYAEFSLGSGFFGNQGDCQRGSVQLRRITTSTSQIELFLDGVTTSKRFTLDDGDTYTCKITILGKQVDGSCGTAVFRVLVKMEGTTTSLTSTVQTLETWFGDANINTPTFAIEADDTNDALTIKVTPANTTSTRWTALLEYVKINYHY